MSPLSPVSHLRPRSPPCSMSPPSPVSPQPLSPPRPQPMSPHPGALPAVGLGEGVPFLFVPVAGSGRAVPAMLPGWPWPRAGPTVSVRALFSYRYRAQDGRDVAMAAGERLLLLRRATPDWWQVRRPGDPPWARPFFVPAAYVAEEEPGNSGIQSPGAATGPPRAGGLSTRELPDTAPSSPPRCQSQEDTGVSPPGPAKERRQRETPPVPTGPPLQVLGSWERHRDPESGRCFFYSPESGISSWKPPRRHRAGTGRGDPETSAWAAAPQEHSAFVGPLLAWTPDPLELKVLAEPN
ncbi:rho GTPase-activating protein 9-like [Cinclus cinclus]|uniref:rho GTPase-activating protein 9-like n=1 Tax=Cinclus cinclus TaxID=127875 RepID=UPI002E0E4291